MPIGRPRPSAQRHVHDRGWALVAGDGGGVVARSRPPLVGRRRELQFARDRLDLAMAGRPQGVVLRGPMGTGKSRLVREVRDLAAAARFQVVEVSAGSDDGLPFGPLGRRLVPLLIDAFGADEAYRSDLAVLRGLVVDPEDGVDRSGDEKWIERRRHELVQRLLTLTRLTIEAAQRQPLVVLIDDLHQADAGTVVFVDQVLLTAERVARHEDVPLLVVAALRSSDAGEAALADQLDQHEISHLLELGGLDRLESIDLLAALGVDADRSTLDSLVEAADGSPLFLESVSRHLVGAPDLGSAGAAAGDGLPDTVRQAVSAAVRGLPAPTREVLTDLALIGISSPTSWLALVTGRVESETVHHLQPAAEARVVELDEGSVRFTHGLRRLAAAGLVPEDERARRHHTFATRIIEDGAEGRSRSAQRALAHHLLGAGGLAAPDLADEQVLLAARDALGTGSWLEAARLFEASLGTADRASDAVDDATRGERCLGASQAWVGALDLGRASEQATVASRCFDRSGDRLRWAEAVLIRYRCLILRGRFDAEPPSSSDLDRVEADPELPERVRIEAVVAASELAWMSADVDAAVRLADEAHRRAHAAGISALAASSLVSRATAAWMTADLEAAARLLAEAERLSMRSPDQSGAAVVSGRLAFNHWMLGDAVAAEVEARRGLLLADEVGRPLERTMPLAVLCAVATAQGDRSAAELRADESLLLHRASGDWWTAPFVHGPLAYAAALAGDQAAFDANLRDLARALGGDAGRGLKRVLGLWGRALAGRSRPGDEGVLLALDDPELAAHFPEPTIGLATVCGSYIEAADLLGGLGPPRVAVERLRAIASMGQVTGATFPLLIGRVLAVAARLDGDLDRAEAEGRTALARATDAGLAVEAARSHLELARVLRQRGAITEADDHASTFLEVATEHRLVGLLEHARRLTDPPATIAHWAPGGGRPDDARSIAVVVELPTRWWSAKQSAGEVHEQVRRRVLHSVGQQAAAFEGLLDEGEGEEGSLLVWFPSVRLAIEFGLRAVTRARRHGATVSVGVEAGGPGVSAGEARLVARGLARLASGDEVLITARATADAGATRGLEFRLHSEGRVEGSPSPLQVLRARLRRIDPG